MADERSREETKLLSGILNYLSGNRGVLLTLNESIGVCFAQTKRIIIASKEPDQLIEAMWR